MGYLHPNAALALRTALIAAGFPPESITSSNEIDPLVLLSGIYDDIEVRTRFFPTIHIPMASLGGPPGVVAGLLKPAVILTGRGGRVELAPKGMPGEWTGLVTSAFFLTALVGVGYMLGRAT